ncbi:MAG: aminotransferase class V-fold PLP-dependent enzyme [Myxococcales bacterium]|nr:aminotransferase class V-fold PLP-dependent enzyme [Myxococcota bacterium]MDW8282995.1 aminotransferase class V-fold PLP-dependent enzyme [Myxococcales bacterium]
MSADPLSGEALLRLRAEFPALEQSVYLVSHSLGAMPRATLTHLQEYTRLWVERGILAWEEWLPEIDRAAERIARIIGAPPGTVIMATNVSQVQAIVASCLEYRPERRRVVYTELNFPSVSYVWKAEERRGAEVVLVPSDDGIGVPTERLLAAIDERTVIVPISHVLFRSSYVQDVAAIVRRAHEVGALVLLDAYQSVGTLPLDVTALGVDMVCGGSVKWLCGGPGAAYLYVRPDLVRRLEPRVTGWFGHRRPFDFAMPAQQYADGIWRYLGGTPAVAALYQARAGAEIIASVGVEAIRRKSLRQTRRILERCRERGYRIRSPLQDERRGGTVVFDLPRAEQIAQELNRRRFLCDHRPGAGLRVSPHLYTTDEEIEQFMDEVDRLAAS